MRKLSVAWKLFFVFLGVILICVAAVGEFALSSLDDLYLKSQEESLLAIAQLAGKQAARELQFGSDNAQTSSMARSVAESSNVRVTIILPNGQVIDDSEEDPQRMEDHSDRPEIKAAIEGRTQPSQRFSATLKLQMLYLAVPILANNQIVGVLRVARPLVEVERRQSEIRKTLLRSSALAVLIAALLSSFLAQRISRPIRTIRRAAERYAKGNYSKRVYIDGPPEYADLARAMNAMADEIEERLRQVNRQRNESESILASMKEGVLAIDREDRILMLNASAKEMFDIEGQGQEGELVQEVFRHGGLQRLLAKINSGELPPSEEMTLEGKNGKIVLTEIVPLRNEEGAERGLLIVFSDVTRLQRLENMRREFVSNVSHELRTPITSIKGFIETLREGAIHDPQDASRFLEIIDRQADRLNAIIVDLLSLSQLERDEENANIHKESVNLRQLLETTVQHLAPQSAQRNVDIRLDCDSQLQIEANPDLLEQAIQNLLDNAIKYSAPGKSVRIQAEETAYAILIHVCDRGAGIAPEHLPRLFERFYRVDAGRSRRMGGTGLGLAIVKHIIQSHGGQVRVSSALGEGSQFTIELPRIKPIS